MITTGISLVLQKFKIFKQNIFEVFIKLTPRRRSLKLLPTSQQGSLIRSYFSLQIPQKVDNIERYFLCIFAFLPFTFSVSQKFSFFVFG